MVEKLNLKLNSFQKFPHINTVLWREILAILKATFLNSPGKMMISIATTLYHTKEQENQSIGGAHLFAMRRHKELTRTYNRIKQKYYSGNMKLDTQKS